MQPEAVSLAFVDDVVDRACPLAAFVRTVCDSQWIYAVAGEDGLARVPSPSHPGRSTTFLWSSRTEAVKWADCVTENPRVKELTLSDVLTVLLPALSEHGRLVAADWSTGPDEPEIEPGELALGLRAGMIEAFAARVREAGVAYVVGGPYGPAMLVSRGDRERLVLPCWSVKSRAEMRIEGPWEEMFLFEIPADSFVKQTLAGLAETGALVCPDQMLEAPTPELEPHELAARFLTLETMG